jgi:hypothetical protein
LIWKPLGKRVLGKRGKGLKYNIKFMKVFVRVDDEWKCCVANPVPDEEAIFSHLVLLPGCHLRSNF